MTSRCYQSWGQKHIGSYEGICVFLEYLQKKEVYKKIEKNEIYCSCNFLFHGPNLRIFMNKKLGVPFIQLKTPSFDGK